MRKVLVTGGTVFVSRFIAEYYAEKGDNIYVLNRNTRPQPAGTSLIEADRHALGDSLRQYRFDVVIDTAYTAEDVNSLLDALGGFGDYVLISSSAVYPESAPQPFTEETGLGINKYWGKYGTDKTAAEAALTARVPGAYILRPPYIYGPMNNVYREAFVFDCARMGRNFYLPRDGEMKLQFFHVRDLCRFIDVILEKKPERHIFNVGNRETVSVRDWVEMCYRAAGKAAEFVTVHEDIEQRNYFSFYDYEYCLDVARQYKLMDEATDLESGLKEAWEWYRENEDKVNKKPYLEYIDTRLRAESQIMEENMIDITIRPYTPQDYDSVSKVHDAARRIELALASLDAAFLPFSFAAENEGFFDYPHIDVAVADGAVAGFCAYTDDELAWLYVSPDMMRRGIGRKLMESALAAEPGINYVEALYGNEPARKLYESFGFTVKEVREGVMTGNEDFHAKGYIMGR